MNTNYQYGKPYFVIAGNLLEASKYIRVKSTQLADSGLTVKLTDFQYVYDISCIRGTIDPNGVFIGTWRKREDLVDIVKTLAMSYRTKNLPKIVLDFITK